MIHRQRLLLALCLALAACGSSAPSVAGRWQRVDQPGEWVEFGRDGRFAGWSFMDTVEIRGRYEQRGDTVVGTSAMGHRRTLELRDTLLVMEDGTVFRRVAEPGG